MKCPRIIESPWCNSVAVEETFCASLPSSVSEQEKQSLFEATVQPMTHTEDTYVYIQKIQRDAIM